MSTSKNILFLLFSIIVISSVGMSIAPDFNSQTVGISAEISDFQIVHRNFGWITKGNQLLWTSDNGQEWEDISPVPAQSLRAVLFLDENAGFAVTSRMNPDHTISYLLSRTNNTGKSWETKEIISYTLIDPDASVESVKLIFLDPNTGWVFFKRMTSSNFNYGTLYHTSDGGETWNQISLPEAGEVSFANNSTGFIVGGIQDQQLYTTKNGGNSWETFNPSPNQISRVSLPYFISSSIGEIVVFEQFNNGTKVKIISTEDSGQHWIEKSDLIISHHEWIYAPISSIPGEIKILTPDQVITYWQTAEHLQIEERSDIENISKFEMSDTDHGWALSHEFQCVQPNDNQSCKPATSLLQTNNGGISWSKIETPTVVTEVPAAIQRSTTISPDSSQVLSRTSLHSGQGFDQCEISSLSNLQKWKTNSPYSVVNLYIGGKSRACNNTNLSTEFIAALSVQGWKFIPTWVGLQASCTHLNFPMSENVVTAYNQGKDQAIDAARTARKYGLSFSDTDESGTVIYYDLEAFDITNEPCLNAAKAFINGWVEELHNKGITAGVYGSVCSSALDEFYTIPNPPDVIWPALWVSDSYNSSITSGNLPCVTNSMWGNQQRIYQYTGAHVEAWGNTLMNIDVDMIDGIVADLSNVVGVPSSTLDNSSFEDGILSPWEISPNNTACNWQVDNTIHNARSGDYYLKLGKESFQTTCVGTSQLLNLTPLVGDTYRFAIWAKSSSTNTYRSLRLGITGMGSISETTTQKFSGIGNQWTCLEVAHTINQGNLTGIEVQVQPEDLDGIEMFLDDAHLALNTGPICAQVIPPTNLTASDFASVDSVVIQWDDVPGATYYKIYRSLNLNSDKTQVGLVLSPLYIDQSGDFYDSYYYWVKACNANNCSIYSSPDQGGFASPFLEFFDGFENGSTSKWIDHVNPEKAWVCNTNPITGQYQLCINANTQTNAYVLHPLPSSTNMVNLNFNLDPNSANIGPRIYTLLEAKDSNMDKTAFALKFTYNNSVYKIKVEGIDNSGTFYSTNWFTIPDTPTNIGIRWNSTIGHLRVSSPLSGFALLINNIEKANLTGISNSELKVDKIAFGALVNQSDNGASGQFYLDDFSFDGPLFIRSQNP